ncbi:unnamed protein product, partial [Symbiodinium sp. KB8]
MDPSTRSVIISLQLENHGLKEDIVELKAECEALRAEIGNSYLVPRRRLLYELYELCLNLPLGATRTRIAALQQKLATKSPKDELPPPASKEGEGDPAAVLEKPELRRAEPLPSSKESHKTPKNKPRSSRKKRSPSSKKHRPNEPTPKKLDFKQETDASHPDPEPSSRPKPSKARHLKDPWVKGSSFDSCWRFCATLAGPSPETKLSAPEEKQRSSDSIPLGYSPGDSQQVSPNSSNRGDTSTSHRGDDSSTNNRGSEGSMCSRPSLKRSATTTTDASSKRAKFDKMYYRIPFVRHCNKLRQLLEKHGSFKELEYHVKKYVRELEKEGKKGRWVTKQYLTDIMKYSQSMVENSWTWAQSRGLVRVNEVHKCEEARLVLEETFEHDLEKGTDREIHAEATLEDEDNAFLDEPEPSEPAAPDNARLAE